eukprot:823305-Pyramimonas_sp.AAC.1
MPLALSRSGNGRERTGSGRKTESEEGWGTENEETGELDGAEAIEVDCVGLAGLVGVACLAAL